MADGSQLVVAQPTNVELYRASTDAAGLCGAIVKQTAKKIGDRQYVQVEGWQAIAIAHGCAASARDVERVEGGVRAIGEVRRMSDGVLIAQAEGFVGEDEPVWFGGVAKAWKWGEQRGQKIWFDKTYEKRPDYAIRAMAQTRAISRACRSAFAHVVVLIDANLSTTPAEEVPAGGFDDEPPAPRNVTPKAAPAAEPTDNPVEADPEGIACPRPNSADPKDWKAWSKVLVATVKAAATVADLDKLERDHAPAIMAGELCVVGLRSGMAEVFAKKREELTAKSEASQPGTPFDDEIPF